MGRHDDIPADTVPPFDPPRARSEFDGYTVQLSSVLGYEIWLTSRILTTPGLVTVGPWWALTFAGAHRKAQRVLARRRREQERRDHVTRWQA